MEDGGLSVAAISAKKLQDVSDKADVTIFKKALNQEAEVAKQLIQSATDTVPAPGVGTKLNVKA